MRVQVLGRCEVNQWPRKFLVIVFDIAETILLHSLCSVVGHRWVADIERHPATTEPTHCIRCDRRYDPRWPSGKFGTGH
jgi:hypothetical protein